MFLLSSCEKEILQEQIQEIQSTKQGIQSDQNSPSIYFKETCEELYNSLSVQNGRLVFESEEQLADVVDCLQSAYDQHIADFLEQNSSLTEEELNDHIDNSGFNEFQPFEDFEDLFSGFISRRAHIDAQVNNWLNQNDPDMNMEPELLDHLSYAERAVLDIEGDFHVGSEVFSNVPPGSSSSVFDPGFIDPELGSPYLPPSPPPASTCQNTFYQKDVDEFSYSGKMRRLSFVLSLKDIRGHTEFRTRMITYRQKNNGNWRKWWVSGKVWMLGNHGQDCSPSTPINESTSYINRPTKRVIYREWPNSNAYV